MARALRSLHHHNGLRHRKGNSFQRGKRGFPGWCIQNKIIPWPAAFALKHQLRWPESHFSFLDELLLKRKPFKFVERAMVIYRPCKPSVNLCSCHQSWKTFWKGTKDKWERSRREMAVKLNTVYFSAKEELPFSKFKELLVLQKKN